jgi:hypothetical protein
MHAHGVCTAALCGYLREACGERLLRKRLPVRAEFSEISERSPLRSVT